MMKSYIPGVDLFIDEKRTYKHSFMVKFVKYLQKWIDSHTHFTPYPNKNYTFF